MWLDPALVSRHFETRKILDYLLAFLPTVLTIVCGVFSLLRLLVLNNLFLLLNRLGLNFLSYFDSFWLVP